MRRHAFAPPARLVSQSYTGKVFPRPLRKECRGPDTRGGRCKFPKRVKYEGERKKNSSGIHAKISDFEAWTWGALIKAGSPKNSGYCANDSA